MADITDLKKAGLKDAQITFLLDIANRVTPAVAYKKAYPTCKTQRSAYSAGTRLKKKLFKNPAVTAWLEQNYADREEHNRQLMSIDDRKEFLVKMILNGKPADALKAMDIYNRMESVYEHRSKVEGDVSLTIGWSGDDDD